MLHVSLVKRHCHYFIGRLMHGIMGQKEKEKKKKLPVFVTYAFLSLHISAC